MKAGERPPLGLAGQGTPGWPTLVSCPPVGKMGCPIPHRAGASTGLRAGTRAGLRCAGLGLGAVRAVLGAPEAPGWKLREQLGLQAAPSRRHPARATEPRGIPPPRAGPALCSPVWVGAAQGTQLSTARALGCFPGAGPFGRERSQVGWCRLQCQRLTGTPGRTRAPPAKKVL